MAVKQLFDELAISCQSIDLGEVRVALMPAETVLTALANKLSAIGFEILDQKQNILIDKVKKALQEYLADIENTRAIKLSAYLADKIHYEYTYISDLFSSTESISIEQYFIRLRIEKAKELLVYNNFTMAEIADVLGFSSVNHFSAQFKKVTGVSPSAFKNVGAAKRKAIDKI